MISEHARKYCILGGGVSGIGIAKCLVQADIPFDLIERDDNYGGNWNIGGSGSKMYQSTHLISSKMNTQFSDFPMPADYPPYIKHDLMLKYILSVADHFKLREHTEFNRTVEKLEPVGDFWRVSLDNNEERLYKGVIVCNGMLRQKRMPSYVGNFEGEIIHSIDYLSAEQVRGKRVLVVGAGNSGCDIAVDVVPNAAKVFHSTRRGYHYMPKFIDGKPTQEWLMELAREFDNQAEYWKHVKKIFKLAGFDGTDYGLPAPDHDIFQAHPIMNSLVLYHIGHGDVFPKPDVKEFTADGVIFEDGSKEKLDMVIYATGFRMSFPFFSQEHLKLNTNSPDLYAHVFHKEYDNILFFGYVNAPTGIGTLINTMGRLTAAYLPALEKNTKSMQLFRKMKKLAPPDLGHKVYMHTDRHEYEVDLWELIKFTNSLRTKFEEDL